MSLIKRLQSVSESSALFLVVVFDGSVRVICDSKLQRSWIRWNSHAPRREQKWAEHVERDDGCETRRKVLLQFSTANGSSFTTTLLFVVPSNDHEVLEIAERESEAIGPVARVDDAHESSHRVADLLSHILDALLFALLDLLWSELELLG